jgi:hypothetical protein
MQDRLASAPERCVRLIDDIKSGRLAAAWSRIPLILSQVFYARPTARVEFERDVSASARAEIDARITAYASDPSVGIEGQSIESGSVSLIYKERLPVAYRPAFISLSDIERVEAINAQGFFDFFLDWVFGDNDETQTIDEVIEKCPEIIVEPNEMYSQMGSGDAIPFNEKDERHLSYIWGRGLLLAASWEAFPEEPAQ